jgi:hypothetical protein
MGEEEGGSGGQEARIHVLNINSGGKGEMVCVWEGLLLLVRLRGRKGLRFDYLIRVREYR